MENRLHSSRVWLYANVFHNRQWSVKRLWTTYYKSEELSGAAHYTSEDLLHWPKLSKTLSGASFVFSTPQKWCLLCTAVFRHTLQHSLAFDWRLSVKEVNLLQASSSVGRQGLWFQVTATILPVCISPCVLCVVYATVCTLWRMCLYADFYAIFMRICSFILCARASEFCLSKCVCWYTRACICTFCVCFKRQMNLSSSRCISAHMTSPSPLFLIPFSPYSLSLSLAFLLSLSSSLAPLSPLVCELWWFTVIIHRWVIYQAGRC